MTTGSFDWSLTQTIQFSTAVDSDSRGKLGLKRGMKVLDMGMGVGGPMRNIARFSGADVFGMTLLSDVRTRLDQAGIAYGEVRSLADLSQHPALRRQDTIINGNLTETVASPISGPVKVKAYIPKLGGQTLSIRDEFTER